MQLDTVHGQTPLSWATGNGYEGIVKPLLGWKDANYNTGGSSKSRQAPLKLATKNKHHRVAELL